MISHLDGTNQLTFNIHKYRSSADRICNVAFSCHPLFVLCQNMPRIVGSNLI